MAFIFKGWRPNIARRMACSGDDKLKRWLGVARFAKTSNGYWLAWHEGDDVDRIEFLTPDHPEGKECQWLDSFDKNDTIETAINYIESGEFEEDDKNYPDGFVFNLFIQNPETGEWE
jgi:hypothetical protein